MNTVTLTRTVDSFGASSYSVSGQYDNAPIGFMSFKAASAKAEYEYWVDLFEQSGTDYSAKVVTRKDQ